MPCIRPHQAVRDADYRRLIALANPHARPASKPRRRATGGHYLAEKYRFH